MRSHTVVAGDTLNKISFRYYGIYNKWPEIVTLNPQLAGRKLIFDGSPVIYPGDVLYIGDEMSIPVDVKNDEAVVLAEGAEQDISIYIDGKLYTGFTGYTLNFSVDSLDSFSFSAPWQDEKTALRGVFKPFAYKKVVIYYDNKKLFTGVLLSNAPVVVPDSKTITIQGYPLCGVLNDCTLSVTQFPASFSGMTLQQIADTVCAPFGIQVSFSEDSGAAFEDVSIEVDTKVLSFLTDLAKQRGFVYTNDENGMLLFWKPKAGTVSATFKEGSLPYLGCKTQFATQSMYSHISGFSTTEDEEPSEVYTYENPFLKKEGVFRPYNFTVEDADSVGLENAVIAEAGRMFSSGVSYELSVVGHKDKNGDLYKKNSTVSVLSPGGMIYRETKLHVYALTLKRSDTEGVQAIFKLVLPNSLEGNVPEVLPWEA